MRAFIAIELDAPIKARIAGFIRSQFRLSGVRWSTEDQLHITLKFLGEIPRSSVARVGLIMESAASTIAPFELELGGLGGFPAAHAPRVVWLGVADAAQGAQRWLAAADLRLAELEIPREERPFHPHVTLGRAKTREAAAELGAHLRVVVPLPPMRMTVRELVLFQSALHATGARHSVVRRAPFAGR